MKDTNQQIYCALDLETTGFDPLKEEIIEVGFVFFTLKKSGVKVLEQYTQVFKPTKSLRTNIQGLTGITPKELENAPLFSEEREALQEKLKDAVLVGHNIIFDIKFLETNGIKLSGRSIDTLDLVQFILPTYHSYNLENLIHFFKLKATNSHRALADSKCAMLLMTKCAAVFQSLPKDVKLKAQQILSAFPEYDKLFSQEVTPEKLALPRPPKTKSGLFSRKTKLNNKQILTLPASIPFEYSLACITPINKNVIFVAADKKAAFKMWSEGLSKSFWIPSDTFSPKKFEDFLEAEAFTWDEAKFALKILIWQTNNWQKESTLDLNLNFFGGQFKPHITAETALPKTESTTISTTIEGLNALNIAGLTDNFQVIAFGLDRLEQNLIKEHSIKVSWGSFIYELKQIYNPQTFLGQEALAIQITDLLSRTDLLFGLTSLALHQKYKSTSQVSAREFQESYPVEFNRLAKASEKYTTHIDRTLKLSKFPELKSLCLKLTDFFSLLDNKHIAWFEWGEAFLGLHADPVEVSREAGKLTSKAKQFSVLSNSLSLPALAYYKARLKFSDFKVTNFKKKDSKLSIQAVTSETKLVSLIKETRIKPAVIVFDSLPEMKIFYDENYEALGETSKIFVEKYSGGSNKITRNFGLYKHSLLLCTADFLKKTQGKLTVNTLIIHCLPTKTPSTLYRRLSDKQLGLNYPQNGPEEYLPEILKSTLSDKTKKVLILEEFNDVKNLEFILKSLI